MVNIAFRQRQRGNYLEGAPKRIARPVHENSFDYFRWSIDNNFGVCLKWMTAFKVEVVLSQAEKTENF